jgi:hypothetical protein
VLNTILYNSVNRTKNEVNKGLRKTLASSASSTISSAQRPHINNNTSPAPSNNDVLFDRKIDLITEGIDSFFATKLRELPRDDALIIVNYIISMKNEINLSDNYRKLNIYVLYKISKFFDYAKSYIEFVREDLLQYLDSLRRPEALDPLHKWIGTYNTYRTLFIRFFKWLYYTDIEPQKRPRPSI